MHRPFRNQSPECCAKRNEKDSFIYSILNQYIFFMITNTFCGHRVD